MIARRALISGCAGGWLVAPLAGRSQPTRKLHRIGMLSVGADSADMHGPEPRSLFPAALVRGLRELGYRWGEHFTTEARSAEGRIERFDALADELIRAQLDVIVAVGPALMALRRATSTLPVVMAGAEDPVGAGLIRSLARPGTNFTGLSNQSAEATVKRLELLKEIVPRAAVVAVLWDPESPLSWQAVDAAARRRGWKVLSYPVRDAAEIEAAIRSAAAGAGAVLPVGGLTFRHSRRIAEIALASRLPALHTSLVQAGPDGLISFGANLALIWHRAATFVDRILKGANPAEMPVEQPTKFDLAINMKTARTLGLAIPPSLLLRADEVIECSFDNAAILLPRR